MSNNRKKGAVPSGYATEYACSVWLGRDRQTIKRLVADNEIQPMKSGRYNYFKLADIVDAMLGGDQLDLQQEKARLAVKQCEKASLQIREMEKHLVPVDDVVELWQRMVAATRSRLLSIPTKAAPLVMAAADQKEAKDILKAQVYEAIRELHTKLTSLIN